ncbi:mucoidy inhibitor MuiA family protein [Pelomyxa schiedti]|nr:mucoidy inhibitor MuiA family protein [Pelomyxa schiedti]
MATTSTSSSSPTSVSATDAPTKLESRKLSIPVHKCAIESVTVYNDRAEVVRLIDATLEKGQYVVSLTGVSTALQANSVHVSGGTGAATILEVSSMVTYDETADTALTSEITEKKEALEKLRQGLKELNKKLEIVNKQQAWLDNWAANVHGTPQVQAKHADKDFISESYLASIKTFMEFYTQQMSSVSQQRASLEREIEEVENRRKILELEIRDRSTSGSTRKNQRNTITITLIAGGGPVVLQVSYVVNNARWSPTYDCRVDSNSSHVQLSYYGLITNSTGEDWIDAHLTLSTATPDIGGVPPELPTSTVGINYIPPSRGARRLSMTMDDMMCVQTAAFAFSEAPSASAAVAPRTPVSTLVTTASDSAGCATFTIPVPSTIASDNKEHKVTVAIIPLDTRFTYTVVPRVSPFSYLKSTTSNNSSFFLLAGACNVFMDNNFVATSSLKDVSPNEEFAFFLGTDKAVKVEYSPPSEMKDRGGVFSRSNVQTWTGAITVKNTKTKEIAVTVYEQLPKSSDERIKVTLIEPDVKRPETNTKLNTQNNLEMRHHIKAGQMLKLSCKYTVESPTSMEGQLHYSF